MGNKCKICGYRFRSKDEAICPECFTARDDDISCERYSASEHSHGRSYGGGLHETGESFVQKEMREERRNSFARENFGARANAGLDLSDDGTRFDQQSRFVRNDYNYGSANQYRQAMPQQSAYQRYIAQQQRKAGTASGYSSQTSGFTPAGQIFAQRSTIPTQQSSLQYYRTTQYGQRKKANSAGAVIFLIIFVSIFGLVIAMSASQENKNRKSSTTTTTTRTTQSTKSTNKTVSIGSVAAEIKSISDSDEKGTEIDKLRNNTQLFDKNAQLKLIKINVMVKSNNGKTGTAKLTSANIRAYSGSSSSKILSSCWTYPKKEIQLTTEGTSIELNAFFPIDSKKGSLYLLFEGQLVSLNFEM